MKKIKATVAVLIALISASSVMVFAHHGGRHHSVYRSVNYCVCGGNYADANNNGVCDNCGYICGGHTNYGHHRGCGY